MSNIGIVTNWSERGAGYVSRQIRESLLKENNIFIFARSNEKCIQELDGSNYIYFSRFGFGTRDGSINKNEFKKWINRNNIDKLIFNEQHWWLPIIWCKEWGIITGTYVDYYTAETIEFFALYDFLICNTDRHYKTFEWHRNPIYIPWGTDNSIFKPEFSDNSSDLKIFFHSCGVSPERKGTDLIIQMAFANLEFLKGKAQFVIHTQIDIKKKLSSLSYEIDILINNRLLLLIEKTVSPPGLYHMGDVYIYPTVLEGIGLTLAEAKSCGLPIITTKNEPMLQFCFDEDYAVDVEYFYSREDGYYWPCSRVSLKSMFDIIIKVINLSSEELYQMKLKSRYNAEKNLNWNTNSITLSKTINEVIFINSNYILVNKVFDFERSRSLNNNLLRSFKMSLFKLYLNACSFFK
jgi:glycosyltransferase involved in cell wall biosynthesis